MGGLVLGLKDSSSTILQVCNSGTRVQIRFFGFRIENHRLGIDEAAKSSAQFTSVFSSGTLRLKEANRHLVACPSCCSQSECTV